MLISIEKIRSKTIDIDTVSIREIVFNKVSVGLVDERLNEYYCLMRFGVAWEALARLLMI